MLQRRRRTDMHIINGLVDLWHSYRVSSDRNLSDQLAAKPQDGCVNAAAQRDS